MKTIILPEFLAKGLKLTLNWLKIQLTFVSHTASVGLWWHNSRNSGIKKQKHATDSACYEQHNEKKGDDPEMLQIAKEQEPWIIQAFMNTVDEEKILI